MKNNLFSIGEMAKITGVARKTLIYYDKEDLFKPVFVDVNGYRYYDLQQLDTMQAIKMFREFELPLKTIKAYLKNRNKDVFINMMNEVEQVMEQRMRKTMNYLEVIKWKKDIVKAGLKVNDVNAIFIEYKDVVPLYQIPIETKAQGNDDFSEVLSELENEMKIKGIIGHGVYAQVNQTLLKPDYEGTISSFAMGLTQSGINVKNSTIPEGKYVCAYHIGSYQETPKTYKRLFRYIEEKGLIIDGDAYEADLFNFLTEKTEQDYMMEISIKVKSKD